MLKKKQNIKNKEEALKSFAECVAYMLQVGISKKEIDFGVNVGVKAYEKFLKKEKIKTKPKFKVYEINAKDKNEAIKQIRQLELDEKIEKDIINIIQNH